MSISLIEQAMRDSGFLPPNLEPNGKIKRFKNEGQTNPDCWVIVYQWNTRSGEIGYNAVWSDWHTDEIHKFCTINPKGDDLKYVEKTIREAQKKAEDDREKEYEICRAHCAEYFQTIKPGTHPYLALKGIESNFAFVDGDKLIVPVFNPKGIATGYQTIEPNGQKRFKLHTQKKGNYFTIGGSEKTWLVEGFATGCTVHEATGDTVIVCFDAGNIPEVRKHFPNATLAGDSDPAGRSAGNGLFPPTEGDDWNDHYQKFGMASVVELLSQEPSQWIRALGYRDDVYYYTSSSNRQIIPLTPSGHVANNLYSLQPHEYWATEHPGAKGINWNQAASKLMNDCRLAGIFDPRNIRGTGVWLDPEPLINLGDNIYPFKPKSKHTYIISSQVPAPIESTDPDLLLSILNKINFKHPNQGKLLAGWLTIAPFSGALPWRPHVWLTGGAGTGKSTVMQDLISPILGDFKLYIKGNTTEAGIRQKLGHNAIPIIFDEFEQMTGDDPRTKSILDLCRQASSESSGEILKGSSSGKSAQYNPRFCALVSSIRINLSNDADHSRFIVLDLDEPNKEEFSKIKNLLSQLSAKYCHGLFSATFLNFKKFQALAEYHRTELSKTHTARFAQQHSILLAGYELLTGEVITLAKEQIENDHEACLDHLTSSTITVELGQQKQRSIQETIDWVVQNPEHTETADYISALSRYGIQVINTTNQATVNIPASNSQLKRLFHGTRWASGWVKSLSRLPNAVYPNTYKLNSRSIKGVKLEIGCILDLENPAQ